MAFPVGAENPHGAENSALKNTAPFSLTALRTSEKASIALWTLCTIRRPPGKGTCEGRPREQTNWTRGHGRFRVGVLLRDWEPGQHFSRLQRCNVGQVRAGRVSRAERRVGEVLHSERVQQG